jgi:3-methylfumaryl-CoA hydratase
LSAEPNDFSAWIGRTETMNETICPWRAAALAATLDWDGAPATGSALPPAWHWLFFNPVARRRALGTDGHPQRGGFLPPVSLPRRMWAGSRLTYHKPLAIGAEATRKSEILKIETKTGQGGALVFVTLRHSISTTAALCIEEEQDLVYRPAATPGAVPPPKKPAPQSSAWREEIRPDTTLLFRYSALTFNGHRIHYDKTYAQKDENYPDLVVQGPLTATLLQNFVTRTRPEWRLARFSFRGVTPLFVDRPFWIEAAEVEGKPGEISVWARDDEGALSMQASAVFA